MSGLSNYIDRKSSGPGASEKSQNVHSANWQAETQLKKEMNCIHRQEQQRVTKISTDQRILIFRFHRKITRSVDLAKSHDKLKNDLEMQRQQRIQEANESSDEEKEPPRIRHALCMSRTFKPPVPRYRRCKSLCEEEEKTEPVLPPSRPVTAMENSSKMWERQLKHVTSVVQRAKSAPPGKRMPLIDSFQPQERQTKPRAKTARSSMRKKPEFLGVDMVEHRKYRQREVDFQGKLVNNFLNRIQDLKLQPWTPGFQKTNSFISISEQDDKNVEGESRKNSKTESTNTTRRGRKGSKGLTKKITKFNGL